MVYRYLLSNQSVLQCKSCSKKLAELDIEGCHQNQCPHCGAVDTCEPVEEIKEAQRTGKLPPLLPHVG